VGYVYDECDDIERRAIDAHVAICAACEAELAALQSVRAELARWAPPDVDLGLQIVRSAVAGSQPRTAVPQSHEPARRPWYVRPVPVWAQAVAATVIFAAGLSLGVARGLTSSVPTGGAAPASAEAQAVSPTDLQALEQRLRAEMSRIQPAADGRAATAPVSGGEQLLTQVRTLIEESERRQQRELALRTAQVVRDFDSQRQVDLARIQQSFGQIEGLTGAEVREQRQMLNYLIRASEKP
jgi:anti-sigma factor RsiW